MINIAESMVATLKSCLTPTVIFCILNLTIVTIFITSSLNKHHILELGDHEDYSLVQVPSLFEQPDQLDDATDPQEQQKYEAEVENIKHNECVEEGHVKSRSDTCMKAPARRVLNKSASEKVYVGEPEEANRKWPATAREMTNLRKTASDDENEDVDAKADDFIKRFRQQLKLERLESILSNKEMLDRRS